MALDFKAIPQNSRTIIFGRFNDNNDMPNLCKELSGREPSEALDAVDKNLCVKSFEEFKKKFTPTVYQTYIPDENNSPKTVYSLKYNPYAPSKAIPLCEHEFYKAVHDIAMEKSASNKNNNEISYKKLHEAVDPENIYEIACKRRSLVNQYTKNAVEERKKGNLDGAKRWMANVAEIQKAIVSEYKDNALKLLPIAIRETKMILDARGNNKEGDNKQGNTENNGNGKSQQALLYDVQWDNNGKLQLVALENKNFGDDAVGAGDENEKVLQITQKNWEKTADKIPDGMIDKQLFLSVYSSQNTSALAKLPTEQLVKRIDYLGNMYTDAQQSFLDTVGYLVRKVADVEQFFLHAGDDENHVVESGVIITNCTVADVFDNEQIVKDYLKAASNTGKDRIWFAVLPEVEYDETGAAKSKSDPDPDSDLESDLDFDNDDVLYDTESYDTEDITKKGKAVSIADINRLSKLLAGYGILSFFNFDAHEATSFKNFGADDKIIKIFNEQVTAIESKDAAVLAYPNFTIIPKDKSMVEVVNEKRVYTSETLVVNEKKVYAPDIYIDAAYVAAGTVVATQTAEIQKAKFGKRVADKYPFVRFDLEEGESSDKFRTKFNPESRLNMDQKVVTLVRGSEGNAFCFRSDDREPSAYVFAARTLNARPIFWFITQHYFKFLLERTYINGLTLQKANEFAKELNNMIFNNNDDTIVNRILRSEEQVEFNGAAQSLALKFKGGNEQIVIDVTIEDTNK